MTMLCANCQQNQESMSMWMIHLASCHPLPEEWISDNVKRLTDDEKQRPYTVVTDSRKRRRRPTTPRPLNTFMIFSRHIRRNILTVFPEASNSLVSKELGVLWKEIPHDIKSCYENEAKRLVQLHSQEFPDYKYQPKKRSHRFQRVLCERQVSPMNESHISNCTDDENNKEKDNRSSSDIENQYIRYSILGKCLVKECQNFNSPQKGTQNCTTIKQESSVSEPPRSFALRLTNFGDSNIFLRQNRISTENSVYAIPSENLVSNSSANMCHTLGEDFSKEVTFVNKYFNTEQGVEEEIDITSNIFSNDIELEWPEYNDDVDRHEMSLF